MQAAAEKTKAMALAVEAVNEFVSGLSTISPEDFAIQLEGIMEHLRLTVSDLDKHVGVVLPSAVTLLPCVAHI